MTRVLVGRVAGAFGVRGEIRITAYTEAPLSLLRYKVLTREDGVPALTLQTARAEKGAIVARATEVSSKEAADALRGLQLYVARDALPPTEDEDEFYLADLIGLAAESVEGAPLGRVRQVHNFGAGDVLELDPGQGRPTRLIPFTREAAPRVLVGEGRIVLAPPEEIGEREPESSDPHRPEQA